MDEIDPDRFSSEIWLFPIGVGVASRFTFQGSFRAIWAPDGRRIAYETLYSALYLNSTAGTENEESRLFLSTLTPMPPQGRLQVDRAVLARFPCALTRMYYQTQRGEDAYAQTKKNNANEA